MKDEMQIEDWSRVTITNRFMFNKVFTTNIGACRRLLEILLGTRIRKIYPQIMSLRADSADFIK